MAELRRILVSKDRLKGINPSTRTLLLNKSENHYLTRVLRLSVGCEILIIDGFGCLWKATIKDENSLVFSSPINQPLQKESRSHPLLGLAVAIPKRGFKDILRMSSELGVDIIQPLRAERSSTKSKDQPIRWKSIVKEAVEQSERLWQPEILTKKTASDWFSRPHGKSFLAFANARMNRSQDIHLWLQEKPSMIDQIWIAIGPEGGWTKKEEKYAISSGWEYVSLGDTILTTSTAAISAVYVISSWRRLHGLIVNKSDKPSLL